MDSAQLGSERDARPPVPIPIPLHGGLWRIAQPCLITPILGTRLFNDIFGPAYIYSDPTVGPWDRVLYTLGILNHESVRQLHWSINCWEDEHFHKWKEAYVANCSAVAVAVTFRILLRITSAL